MATITLNMSASDLQIAVDAVCAQQSYKDTIDGVANPESRNAFAKRMLIEYITERVKDYRRQQALDAALANLPPNIVIT